MSYGTIRELIELLPHRTYTGAPASRRRAIRGFSTDTRSLKNGEAFIALRGEHFDGHGFLEAARDRGASLAIVDEAWHDGHAGDAVDRLPLLVVSDTLHAYGEIAAAHRRGFAIPVIAVAGSNGKTTTKELIADLLATRYTVLRTEGNLNNLIGVPATVLRLRSEHQVAVVEIGTNMPGEIERLCRILQPTHGIITNIGREHLELLGSLDGVAEEEGALFRYLADHGGVPFVNLDDPFLARLGRRLPRRVTYGRSPRADVRGKTGKLDAEGAPMLIAPRIAGPKGDGVQLRTPGLHTAQNALAAAAVALALKVTPAGVRRALEEFRPRTYAAGYARLAVVRAPDGTTVLNDTYNANPDSAMAALATLVAMRPAPGGKRIAVLADMKELGASSADEHERIGRELLALRGIDLVLLHGRDMRRALAAARDNDLGMRVLHYADKEKLIRAVDTMVKPSDLLLVKGSRSMRMEEVVRAILERPVAD
jgi:UDP-N-acetylmuramoyl-tripeptide--D-alanyl-D-alanine ligase